MKNDATNRNKIFANLKQQCLYSKMDKSSAGQIDQHAVEICHVINEMEQYYTTSSCSGRSFLYTGIGNKQQQSIHHDENKYEDELCIQNNDSMDDDGNQQNDNINDNFNSRKDNIKNNDSHHSTSNATNNNKVHNFIRRRVSHDLIGDAERYFNIHTIDEDFTGGGDDDHSHNTAVIVSNENNHNTTTSDNTCKKDIWWLRYEPFILHVACRSLKDAALLMNAARPSFKNVALTSFSYKSATTANQNQNQKYLVAIWGDEGLDMPLTDHHGVPLPLLPEWLTQLVNERHVRNWNKMNRFVHLVRTTIVNDNNFNNDVYDNEEDFVVDVDNEYDVNVNKNSVDSKRLVRSFDVIGDVAIVNAQLPTTADGPDADNVDHDKRFASIGQSILQKNNAIQIVVARTLKLQGDERSPGQFVHLASRGTNPTNSIRSPFMTTHKEYGISCVIDLERTFFNPRMGPERKRLWEHVEETAAAQIDPERGNCVNGTDQDSRGETILILFAGICFEGILLASRVRPSNLIRSITCIEQNPIAVQCALSSIRMLRRNKIVTDADTIADKLNILQGNVLEIIPTLVAGSPNLATVDACVDDFNCHTDNNNNSRHPGQKFDRIIVPRPKEGGTLDGDIGTGDHGAKFLHSLLTVLKLPTRTHQRNGGGGIVHWYDFVSEQEFPNCTRTCEFLRQEIKKAASLGMIRQQQNENDDIDDGISSSCYDIDVLNIVKVGSTVAKRQVRVCVDFRIIITA